eukprot:11887952-Prorocentrum_lima.AAC.1
MKAKPCGVVRASEKPKQPGTCELDPGVDIFVGVHIYGSGGVEQLSPPYMMVREFQGTYSSRDLEL